MIDVTVKQAAELLKEQDDILILSHRSPDGDTTGSAHGLYLALVSLGKRVAFACQDDVPKDFKAFFPVIPQQDFKEKFIVTVDVADIRLLGTLEEKYTNRVNLSIDHHQSNKLFAEHNLVDGTAAAATLVIAEVVEAMGVTLSKEIATCLYLGLATDTGGFRFSNTNSKTLLAAAKFLDAGVDNGEINSVLFESKTKNRLALESHVIDALQYFYDDQCAVVILSKDLKEKYAVDDDDIGGLSSLPRQIAGVKVGITIKEKDGFCRVSVRTTKSVDASEICTIFGGGGHMRASGCSITGTPLEAMNQLVEVVGNLLK